MTSAPTLRQRRSERRKTEILEAALKVLSEDGYTHASMDKIAEQALLTRVGLYKHYKDKNTLMVALREYKLLELSERVRVALEDIDGFEARLRVAVHETVQYQRDHPGFFRVLLASSFSSDLKADLSLKPFLYTLAGIFEGGMLEDSIHPADPLEYAGLLTTLVFEPSIKQAFVPAPLGDAPPEHIAVLISNIFLRGVLSEAE
jgi:AcrR family transcriptional regulator